MLEPKSLLVHHDDGVPGVQHDETPLRAGSFRVQGDKHVSGKPLIMLNGVHDAQSYLDGYQIV